jgi:tRNA(fMet)-specific endonuclease VapC
MLKYLLDTNILIYTIKNKPAQVKQFFEQHYGQICISSVSLAELIYRAEKSSAVERNLRDIEGLVARIEVLPFDEDAATHAGQIRAELAKQGQLIGPYDQMIAGHVRATGLILVTNNVREFERVSGIRVENWV